MSSSICETSPPGLPRGGQGPHPFKSPLRGWILAPSTQDPVAVQTSLFSCWTSSCNLMQVPRALADELVEPARKSRQVRRTRGQCAGDARSSRILPRPPAALRAGRGASWLRGVENNSLAKGPTICSCEYRRCECRLRWSSLWGHEPCDGCAKMEVDERRGRMRTCSLGPSVELPMGPRNA